MSGQPVWLALAVTLVVLITLAHYITDTHDVSLHNIYRRLSYVPIVLAAFSHGTKGGLLTAVAACLAYAPHAFLAGHRDPSPTTDKVFEMALYLVIGGMTGWLVSRRHQAAQALARSLDERDALEAQLVRAGRMSALGEMAAGLAHEIRNPLASILGSAESLADEFDEGHRKHRMAQLLLKEVHRLDRVVSDFVGFARPAPPQHKDVDLLALVQGVRDLTAAEARQRSIHIEIDESSAPSAISADPDQISQVLLNLFLNAFQALEEAEPDGPRERRLAVRFGEREVGGRRHVCVGVEDTGVGIPESLRESVFDPYVTTRSGGTGLGLSLSNRIIEGHGGFMELDSRDDCTRVWFCLPREVSQ
jgi:signal transduction histidine kinase